MNSFFDDGDSFAAEWTRRAPTMARTSKHGLSTTGQRFSIPGVSIGRLRDEGIAEMREC
jgi:hypothetical protein